MTVILTIEFDPIAFCCEYSEYTIDEYNNDYNQECEDMQEVERVVSYHTTFIPIDNNSFIIQQY